MTRKMPHISWKLQQHSENSFALCGGFLFFQGIVDISGATPEAGLLQTMCYQLAQQMDSMVPEKKKSLSRSSSWKKLPSDSLVCLKSLSYF